MKERGREHNGRDHNGREHTERERERNLDFFERIIHYADAGEFGEENVQQIDEEWAEFERVLRLVFNFFFLKRSLFG